MRLESRVTAVEEYSLMLTFASMPSGTVKLSGDETWYHGGAPGLQVGDYLLPPGMTYSNPRKRLRRRREGFCQCAVYITKYREITPIYAGMYPQREGTIYIVEPWGPIKLDPEQGQYLGNLYYDHMKRYAFDSRFNPYIVPGVCDSQHCCWQARILEVVGRSWEAPPGAWWKADPARIEAVQREVSLQAKKLGLV